jgi:hypothetical protein
MAGHVGPRLAGLSACRAGHRRYRCSSASRGDRAWISAESPDLTDRATLSGAIPRRRAAVDRGLVATPSPDPTLLPISAATRASAASAWARLPHTGIGGVDRGSAATHGHRRRRQGLGCYTGIGGVDRGSAATRASAASTTRESAGRHSHRTISPRSPTRCPRDTPLATPRGNTENDQDPQDVDALRRFGGPARQ